MTLLERMKANGSIFGFEFILPEILISEFWLPEDGQNLLIVVDQIWDKYFTFWLKRF